MTSKGHGNGKDATSEALVIQVFVFFGGGGTCYVFVFCVLFVVVWCFIYFPWLLVVFVFSKMLPLFLTFPARCFAFACSACLQALRSANDKIIYCEMLCFIADL